MAENSTAKKLFYIFLLGVGTYLWWKYAKWVKEKIDESETTAT